MSDIGGRYSSSSGCLGGTEKETQQKSPYAEMRKKNNDSTETNEAAAAVPATGTTAKEQLTVISLNMEFYQQYRNALDKPAYEDYLQRHTRAADVLCAQEDLWRESDAFLQRNKPFGAFTRIVSSFEKQAAHDVLRKNSFLNYDESFTSTLGNSIYVKSELLSKGGWTVITRKVVQISSDLVLPNGVVLEYRCVVCATLKLKHECQSDTVSNRIKPVQVVQILCTHLSGGRFEDQYMEDPQLVGERRRQMQHCFDQHDPAADNILVGDFNASATKTAAMDGYWQLLRQQFQTELSATHNLSSADFYAYMMAPFAALADTKSNNKNDDDGKNSDSWHLLYETLDGSTSRFGHVVDYFITSPQISVVPRSIKRVRMIKEYMPWVRPTADDDFLQPQEHELDEYVDGNNILKESITDHNGVQVTFSLSVREIILK